MTRISSKNRVTLPVDALRRSGLRRGDEIVIESDGPDRLVVRRVANDPGKALGVFDGLYPRRHLDELRAGERA